MHTGVALFMQKDTGWGRPDRGYSAADPEISGHAIPSSIRLFARSNFPARHAMSTPAPAWPEPTAVPS
jgi:hypothetical protein